MYIIGELGINHEKDIFNIMVIGELMCNTNIHEYETKRISREMACFWFYT